MFDPRFAPLLIDALRLLAKKQDTLMIELSGLKQVVTDLNGSVANEIANRVDTKAIQAQVDDAVSQLASLHKALTADAGFVGLAAVAQALNEPVVVVDAPVAPATPESPVAPVAPDAAPVVAAPLPGFLQVDAVAPVAPVAPVNPIAAALAAQKANSPS